MAFHNIYEDLELAPLAVKSFHTALTELTLEKSESKWVAIQAQLAVALSEVGQRTNDKAALKQSITAYQAALAKMSSKNTNLNTQEDWAYSQSGLGITSLHLVTLQQTANASEAKQLAQVARKAFKFSQIVYAELYPQQYKIFYADILKQIDELLIKLNR